MMALWFVEIALESEGNIIARAYALAHSGQCRSITELEKTLKREGHSMVHEHLSGSSIRGELKRMFAAARAAK